MKLQYWKINRDKFIGVIHLFGFISLFYGISIFMNDLMSKLSF